jgi:hypothetical protein
LTVTSFPISFLRRNSRASLPCGSGARSRIPGRGARMLT